MNDLSVVNLILEAGIVVKLVMFILLIASFWSWSIVFYKIKMLKKTKKEILRFKEKFYATGDLSRLFHDLEDKSENGIELVFVAGFKEYARLKQKELQYDQILNGVDRIMGVAISREVDAMEKSLPFLATVGSTSPYIGLFGTVWGIMNSFNALGSAKSVSLAMVAPGISEALIATAMGLFVAIPGVIFYNRFATETNILLNKYQTFQEEFITIIQRQ